MIVVSFEASRFGDVMAAETNQFGWILRFRLPASKPLTLNPRESACHKPRRSRLVRSRDRLTET